MGGAAMFYVGIDVGKNTHVASMLDASRKVVFKAFSFANTREGAQTLLERIERAAPDKAQVEIGMEATGHYWLALYSFLLDEGYRLHVINPLQTDGWRKGVEIRKRKTDDIDSVLIAELIRYGEFLESKLMEEDLLSLRTLTRFRSQLVDSIADLKRQVICVLDKVFPEYEHIFSEVFGTTSKEVLLTYATPADLEHVSVEQLTELLLSLSRKRCDLGKAQALSDAAKTSFGVTFCRDAFSLQLRILLEQMKFIEQQVRDVEREIKTLMDKRASPITSITGIGPVLGAVILGEIGDISRFSSASKLVAYAGIDASVSQSGQFESANNRMSKRGSAYLRRALYQAATVAAFHDPVLAAFYDKKRAEGKHHKTCIGAVSRKLCFIIFAVLSENRPFVKRQP